jgi:hypothetical protein
MFHQVCNFSEQFLNLFPSCVVNLQLEIAQKKNTYLTETAWNCSEKIHTWWKLWNCSEKIHTWWNLRCYFNTCCCCCFCCRRLFDRNWVLCRSSWVQ